MGSRRFAIGFTATLLVINLSAMGLVAIALAPGTYSSPGQEHWYRYGSIGFVVAGAILPGTALLLGASRSPLLMFGLSTWMLLALAGFCFYLMMSGGGM